MYLSLAIYRELQPCVIGLHFTSALN